MGGVRVHRVWWVRRHLVHAPVTDRAQPPEDGNAPTIPTQIRTHVAEYAEPLGLDRWSIRLVAEPDADPDARASCAADPDYREATIRFDLAKLETGDDLEETTVHELTHCLTWPIHAAAEHLANTVCNFLPDLFREPLRVQLQEYVREAAERSTTDVGQTFLRYHRRLRDARAEIVALKREIKDLRKAIPPIV